MHHAAMRIHHAHLRKRIDPDDYSWINHHLAVLELSREAKARARLGGLTSTHPGTVARVLRSGCYTTGSLTLS